MRGKQSRAVDRTLRAPGNETMASLSRHLPLGDGEVGSAVDRSSAVRRLQRLSHLLCAASRHRRLVQSRRREASVGYGSGRLRGRTKAGLKNKRRFEVQFPSTRHRERCGRAPTRQIANVRAGRKFITSREARVFRACRVDLHAVRQTGRTVRSSASRLCFVRGGYGAA